jgi:hypothetical protein
MAVVSLRGELDFFGACILRAHLSEIRRQAWARCVADLVGPAQVAGDDTTVIEVDARTWRERRAGRKDLA